MPKDDLTHDSSPGAETANSASTKGATVARAGGIMMLSLLLSRVLGLVRNTVMVSQFGIGLDADAYRVAVAIPDTLFMLIAGGGLSSAFIPVFSELYYTQRIKESWKAFSVIVTLCSIAVTILIGLAWIAAPLIAGFMTQGKTYHVTTTTLAPVTPTYVAQVVRMGRIMLPAQFAFLVGSILLGTLYARKQFAAPGLAPNVYNVGIIIGAIVGGSTSLGIAGMSWGALIGAMIGNLVLPVLFMIPNGGSFWPSLDLKADGVKKFIHLLLPVIIGFSLPGWASLITQKYASMYAEGTNITISLANDLMMAPAGIFGQSLALAAFPALSQFFAEKRMDAYREQVSKTLRTVIYLSIPASALIFAMAPQIVMVIYGYGKAQASGNLPAVSGALQIYCLGIAAWSIQPVLMRGFFSMHKTAKPVILGSIVTVLFVLMCIASTKWSPSPLMLVWSSNAAAILLVIALYAGLEMEVGKLDIASIAKTGLKSLGCAAISGAVAYGALHFLPPSLPKLGLLFTMAVVFSATGWIYFATTRALGMTEADYLARSVNRRNKS